MPFRVRYADCPNTLHSAQDDRALLTYLTTSGLLYGRGNNCARTPSGLTVTIDTGELSVPYTKTGQKKIWSHCVVTDAQQVTFDAGGASNRYDALVAEIYDEDGPTDTTDAQNGEQMGRFKPVKGSTALVMTDNEITTALGHSNWLRIDDVAISAGASTLTLTARLSNVDLSTEAKSALQTYLTGLYSSTANGKGASQVGVEDAGNNYAGATVEAVLAEIPTLLLSGPKIFGDGSDGTQTWTSGATLDPTAATKKYTSVTLPAGQTLTVSPVNTPLVILSTGSVTINGTVDLNGKGGAKGTGGSTNTNNSTDGTAGNSLNTSWTAGKGLKGTNATSNGGGGGASGLAAGSDGTSNASSAGAALTGQRAAMLASMLRGVCCGAGGGGGGAGTTAAGGDGGAGGGALVWFIGGNLTLGASSVIRANGANGSNGSSGGGGSNTGGGGGGAGGMILVVVGGSITNSGVTASASAGTGGTGAAAGGNGAAGAVMIYSLKDGTLIAA